MMPFQGVVANYRLLPDAMVAPAAHLIPPVELLLGATLLLGLAFPGPELGAAALLLLFALAMGINLRRGRRHIDCGCFQSALKQTLSWTLVMRNVVLASLVGVALSSNDVPDDLLAAIDYCYAQGWTDGLPVIPPVMDRVHAMLAYEGRPPEAVIATHPATGLQLTVHSAAVNAVMAGCLPEYFPVLVAAFEAMDKPPFNFHGSTASTGGSAPLLIVSGPVADDIGMNADVNLFGPGNRANATIGRLS